MFPLLPTLAIALANVQVSHQSIEARLDPMTGEAYVESMLNLTGEGELRLRLRPEMRIDEIEWVDADGEPGGAPSYERNGQEVDIDVAGGAGRLRLVCSGTLADNVEAGEIEGQIHNFSVHAHVGEDGVFLSDDAAWHPLPLEGDSDLTQLHTIELSIEPIDGWRFVASGDPEGDGPVDEAVWTWRTPRPADGVAVAGNQHEVIGVVHETERGPVEIVMHVSPENARLAQMFIDEAGRYLDLYVPRLGAFPYRRFTIVENFFSSGFALPGFTVLGPRVVAMAPRSLAPGYLDHELAHNWWGNGVYVDRNDGNWCEAVTSYCANYWRRIADDGEEAGRDYRRGIIMKVSSDPSLDDGPLGTFGSADPSVPGAGRFVGYDKGSFVFMMLEQLLPDEGAKGEDIDREPMWRALRRFASDNLGKRADWSDLQAAFEQESDRDLDLDDFFDHWVREHTVPMTPTSLDGEELRAFRQAFPTSMTSPLVERGVDDQGPWAELDPEFARYRRLPPEHVIPTLGGTTGPGGVAIEGPDRPEMQGLRARLSADSSGENLFLVGREAFDDHASLLERVDDSIEVDAAGFSIDGQHYDDDAHAVMHTMAHPDRPGRFVTIFLANGDVGWTRLRLAPFYTRDTTIIWSGDEVIARRTHEPSRKIRLTATEDDATR